ncbi:MAG: hypothetical protein ACTHLO_07725 [Pseudolabrys sp.]
MPDTQGTTGQQRTRETVEGAYELACYVVQSGVTDADGNALPFADIQTIETTAATLGIVAVTAAGGAAASTLTAAEWTTFEQAYYRLAIATRPVTAETLRNTRYAAGAGGAVNHDGRLDWDRLLCRILGYSPAQRFTRELWILTFLIVLLVAVTEWKINKLGMVADSDSVKVELDLWQWVQPWAYGALGACAALLRSAHYFIYARSFDLRRTPEYFNRILLGAISGGAIILFVNYLISQDDTFSHIGTTALGFIAGYSTDFLFNTVERVVTALFPKVDVQTVPQDNPPKKPPKPPAGQNQNGGNGDDGGGDGQKQ